MVALFAFFASARSCSISNQSLQIAENAIEISKKQFIQINKPFLTSTPKRFSNETYFELERDENIVTIRLKFVLKNVGNVAAINIHPPDKIAMPKDFFIPNGGILKYKIPPNVILGPGDNFFLTTQIKASFNAKEGAIKFYEDLTKNDEKGVTIMLPVNYQSEIDPNTKLNLITEYKITKNAARIIRSEMKILICIIILKNLSDTKTFNN